MASDNVKKLIKKYFNVQESRIKISPETAKRFVNDAFLVYEKSKTGLVRELLQTQPDKQRQNMIESLSEKLEAISATADQLLAQVKPRIKVIELPRPRTPKAAAMVAAQAEPQTVAAAAAPEPEKAKVTTTDAKLSDYYGVNQVNDAIAFVTLYPRAKSVHVAGDFNGWQPSKLPLEKVGENGVWQASVKLHPGKYRYRLVVDGQWQRDPYNELTELNPFGGYNSVVEVK